MENCNNHDHVPTTGECLVIEPKYAMEERQEALAHKSMDAKEEQAYIKKVNDENKEKVKLNNQAPF